jgi:indolepyruvate ferredoxin oxidoreductase alpha subunit
MAQELLMGNQAIALGAIKAGVGVVSGYPGTPSTEILETIAKRNPGNIYVEWSVNEKVAMEVAAGAAYTGTRSIVTMKQVGLNVASDPLMSLAYVGVKGGMVVIVADDPGPISSQTEQDTRQFAIFSKLPIFDPSSPEEAYEMIQDAFEYSEKYNTPVLFRPTTRVCHGCASIEIYNDRKKIEAEGFKKDAKWVIFPKLSYQNHIKIEERNPILAKDFSSYRFNTLTGNGTIGIVSAGISYAYTCEALTLLKGAYKENQRDTEFDKTYKLLKIATSNPFPEDLALKFFVGLKKILVIEELDPVIEKELVFLCGKHHLPITISGKLTGHICIAGENSVDSVKEEIALFLNLPIPQKADESPAPMLPIRPPVLCAGCPHRASFYAVKQAMKGQKAVFAGDIGCYTLGNAKPLDMVDTCLCMGAGVTIAQGIHRAQPDTKNFAFIGDSTFFHSGITGVINAVYNETDIVLVVLDNSTTAMTGHQPHPGTGVTMMGNITDKISIPEVLKSLGVKKILTTDPFNLTQAIKAVKEAALIKGVSAVIFKSPCIAVTKPSTKYVVDNEKCIGCKRCIKELGCPTIVKTDEKVAVDSALCFGCGLCAQVCPVQALVVGGAKK